MNKKIMTKIEKIVLKIEVMRILVEYKIKQLLKKKL